VEASPSSCRNTLSYGIKLGASVASVRSYPAPKIPGMETEVTKPFFTSFGCVPALYVEYAFTDYIGSALEIGYMKLGGSVVLNMKADAAQTNVLATNAGKANVLATNAEKANVLATIDTIVFSSPIYVYPLGRETGKGILKIGPGIAASCRIGKGCGKIVVENQSNRTEVTQDMDAEELALWNLYGILNVGYEWASGFSLEGKYGFGFLNVLSEKGKNQILQQYPGFTGELKGQYLTLSLGLNIASMFDI